jgi:ABC-2 type transport system permease protein
MSVLRLYYLTEMFMSGRILPLTTLPGWAQTGAKFVHFRYTNAFPVLTLMGELSPSEVTQGLLIQVGWIAFFCVLARVLFNRGVRQYSGVGM